jgi:hypothetical protein
VDGRIILKIILEGLWRKVMNWMHLAQDRDKWRVPVNTVMGFIKGEEFPD